MICFEGTSIDQNIDERFGPPCEKEWRERKARTIDGDAAANPSGIFVWEEADQVVGYITSTINRQTKIGHIPNMSVLPELQGKGIGKALMKAALDYLESEGMTLVRIETLVQNRVGPTFYPSVGFQEIARQIHYAMPIEDRKI